MCSLLLASIEKAIEYFHLSSSISILLALSHSLSLSSQKGKAMLEYWPTVGPATTAVFIQNIQE
jgi:hypothetical protein